MSELFEPRSAVVEIFTGDYLDRIRDLEARADAAREAQGDLVRGGEVPEYLALAREHDALVAEARERALRVRVTAMPRRAWRALVAEHPPRTVEDAGEDVASSDVAVGVNEATFKDALVVASCDVDSATLDAISDADFDRLYLTAFGLNRGEGEAPKASLVSRLTPTSSETFD